MERRGHGQVAAAALEGRGLVKRFGATTALDGVDLALAPGETLAIFGENGAGKSTLARILCGATAPDEGTLLVDGRPTRWRTPREALQQGVTLVPQELAGCPALSVAENIYAGHLPARRGLTRRRLIADAARRLCERFEVEVDVEAPLAELPLADRQLVEILKGLSRDARTLILDEPTATLTVAEAERVLGHVRRLVQRGLSAVIITHRIPEALALADRTLVLRNGRVVHSGPSRDTDATAIVRHMLGSAPTAVRTAGRGRVPGAPVLQLSGWRTNATSPLDGLDLAVHAGEVVAAYGLRGSGVEALAAGLAGGMRGLEGRVRVGAGEDAPPFASARARREAGVSYVPSDRRGAGLVLVLSIRENLLHPTSPPELRRAGVRRRAAERAACRALVEEYAVRCAGIDQQVSHLSGGNQQKVLLASRLLDAPPVVVLHEPTRGVDIGARQFIHERVRDLPSEGRGVLVISSDIDEVIAVADRVVVIRHGVVERELHGADITQERILLSASGEGW